MSSPVLGHCFVLAYCAREPRHCFVLAHYARDPRAAVPEIANTLQRTKIVHSTWPGDAPKQCANMHRFGADWHDSFPTNGQRLEVDNTLAERVG